MHNLEKGAFFGNSRKELHLNGLTIVESAYHGMTHCPWHYHQNAYFAFTTSGHLLETYKQREIALRAGSLTYHHSQEPHCNSRYSHYVSALHVDIDDQWFAQYDVTVRRPEGFIELRSPDLKILFIKLLLELKRSDSEKILAIESGIVNAFNAMLQVKNYTETSKPAWQQQVKDLLYAKYDEPISLLEIAKELKLHPVYLCQQFPKVFHCTLSEYVRRIKIEKAAERLINNDPVSLTSLAYDCGFSDQSHFIRLFKKHIGFTPLHFRKLVQPHLQAP